MLSVCSILLLLGNKHGINISQSVKKEVTLISNREAERGQHGLSDQSVATLPHTSQAVVHFVLTPVDCSQH